MTRLSRPLRLALVGVALVIGFALRFAALDTYGFSEDETSKLRAIDAYRRGDFSVNAEHPMLMKLAMWGALDLAHAIEREAGTHISAETAVRLPNVVAGTGTIALVAGTAGLLFSPEVGVIAGLLVAFDPNVIAVNRLGKEDTLLLFFFFLAVWCYERAKRIGLTDLPRAKQWYTAAGAAFGLMLASKYMPHYLGLYALYNVIYLRDAGPNSPDKRRYYAAMLAAFVVANFAIVLPGTWSYCLSYLQGRQLAHHGFQYAGTLYVTDVPVSPNGVPVTYYLRMIATKVSMPVLAAALIGLVPLVRQRRERGFVWLQVMLFFLLIGYSLAAAKFQRYGLPILVLVDILAAIGIVWVVNRIAGWHWMPALRAAAAAGVIAVIVVLPLAATLAASPFYSLFQNAIGARLAPPATVFPEEAYDYGVREAVEEIARTASPHAMVISDAPGVVAHYAARTGRRDLDVESLSASGLGRQGERWVLVQDGHIYFENADLVQELRHAAPAWREYRLRNTPVLVLYRLPLASVTGLPGGAAGPTESRALGAR